MYFWIALLVTTRLCSSRGAKAQEVVYPAKQKWALDPEVDVDTRRVCEAS